MNDYMIFDISLKDLYLHSNGVTKGEANGQLPISFGGLPIVIFYQ
jgi:hypothetical protein